MFIALVDKDQLINGDVKSLSIYDLYLLKFSFLTDNKIKSL